jgi:hypothetical protein
MGAYRLCAQVFYVLDLETGKHVVVSRKQKIVRDENMNQFEEVPLFTNPVNIKHIEKDFDKNPMPYV